MIRQAVILCGGAGTRLGNLTKDTPKPMLPVGGRPFIEHLMQEVTRYGISEIILLTGYLGEQFDQYDGTTINHACVRVCRETEPLGTWGGVVAAKDLLEPWFLLMNGDSWLDYNLTHMLTQHPSGIHMLGRFVKNADRYETLNINRNQVNQIIPRGEAEHGFINSGIYAVNRIQVEHSSLGPSSLEKDVLPGLACTGRLTVDTCQSSTYFIDIGVPADYDAAQYTMVEQRTKPALFVDRDNCLTYDHLGYTHHPRDMQFKPGAAELIKHANQNGWYVFVVTNQGGVTKGQYAEHYVLDFHRKMQYNLANNHSYIDALEYEIALDSNRRKPGPGMIKDLMSEWMIDVGPSFMIGDKVSDAEAGINAGIAGYQIDDQADLLEQFGEYIVRK